ncbi:MAG: UxaA family hydrolase [Candidatus Korobacteraceae bacterium]
MTSFFGFPRPGDMAGTRNHVLVLPAGRVLSIAATRVTDYVAGTKTAITGGAEVGRHKKDRERVARLLTGFAKNPNTYATIILGAKKGFGYQETEPYNLAHEIAKAGKPVEVLTVEQCGGLDRLVEEGIALARRYVHAASLVRREPVSADRLMIGVKCGESDATSGIAGNPSFGRAADLLIRDGGSVIFSETTELIGAEADMAERCADDADAKRLLEMVSEVEEAAKRTGEDIRGINPLPSNIAAGISTLEEKSLGAVRKAGTSKISNDPPMLATNNAVVAPLMIITGNPRTASKAKRSIDFSSGAIITGESSVEQMGEALYAKILSIASGEVTKGETIRYSDPLEPYYLGPVF